MKIVAVEDANVGERQSAVALLGKSQKKKKMKIALHTNEKIFK